MNFLKTTLIGGITFLMPLTVLALLLGYAHRYTERLVTPIAERLPVDAILMAKALAVALIVLFCFFAGLLSRSAIVARWITSLDTGLVGTVPGYAFLKRMAGGMTGNHQEDFAPVLLALDDAWQLAFEVDRLPDGRCVVFVPNSPDPSSGSVLIVEARRVQTVHQTVPAIARTLRALGRGTSTLVTQPEAPRRGDGA